MELIGQLVTIGAVITGAVASYVFSRLSENARFARELRTRWDQRRLEAYGSYVTAVKASMRSGRAVMERRIDDGKELGVYLETLRVAEQHRSELFEMVILLGDAEVINAAHQLNSALWSVVRPVEVGEALSEEELGDRVKDWVQALNNFHQRARESLGVSGGFGRQDIAIWP
ncbi:hypothetical protein ACQPZZ_29020 [Microbispora sp. CA-135349]|uniref:hypothetical protein n=1 Tax=Microbispora sp. CA-135349 TaxID=3239953 RepID=UPI003D8B6F24